MIKEQNEYDWIKIDIQTFSETRRAITLLNADRIPAKMGSTISLKPKTTSVLATVSLLSPSPNCNFRLSQILMKSYSDL